MERNVKLKTAIWEKGLCQKDFARVVGDHHTFVSRVVNGWVNLDEARKIKYAKALGKKTEEVFSE